MVVATLHLKNTFKRVFVIFQFRNQMISKWILNKEADYISSLKMKQENGPK